MKDFDHHALQEENLRLRRAVEELSILNELARAVSAMNDSQKIMQIILKRSLKAVNAEQGVITLIEPNPQHPMKTLIRGMASSSDREQYHLSQNAMGWMILNKKPLLCNNFETDPRFAGIRDQDPSVRSVLCVPLLVKNELKGVLTLVNKKQRNGFSDDDQRLLSIIAAQSAQVIENARLYEEEKKKLIMEQELAAAREVQMSLLPNQLPQIPGIQLAAANISAHEVGGDYYDVISLNNQRYGIVVGDVSGKGLSAALLTTMGKGMIYAQIRSEESPKKLLQELNKIARLSFRRKSFITLLMGLLDAQARTLTLSSAGHCCPLVYRATKGNLSPLPLRGAALNFMDNLPCEEKVFSLQAGDIYVFYSDGITEAQNLDTEFFGEERLANIVQEAHTQSAEGILQRILDAVRSFVGPAKQADDMTLVILKVTKD